jgi:hypothetical protein
MQTTKPVLVLHQTSNTFLLVSDMRKPGKLQIVPKHVGPGTAQLTSWLGKPPMWSRNLVAALIDGQGSLLRPAVRDHAVELRHLG